MTAVQVVRDAVLDELIDQLEDEVWDIPCEETHGGKCDRPAEWILHRARCCPSAPPILVMCTGHKERLLALVPPVHCARCGITFRAISQVIKSVEPLNGRPA